MFIFNYQGRLRFALISLCFLSTSAFAAIPSWQGPYLGAYIGDSFGVTHATTNVGAVTSTSYFTNQSDIDAINYAGTSTTHPNSIIAGFTAGHDWAWKKMVYGIALDYGTLSLNSSTNLTNTYVDGSSEYSVHNSITTNWLFTLRGKLGYEVALQWPSLLYFTGGMAITKLTVSNNFTDTSSLAGTGGSKVSQNQIGWTAGAGIEMAVFDHATVNVEYLYVRVPSLNTTSTISNSESGFGIPAQSLNNSFSTRGYFHTGLLKVGLNYRF